MITIKQIHLRPTWLFLAIWLSLVLAGCSQNRPDYSDQTKSQALTELLADTDRVDQAVDSASPSHGGSSPSNYSLSAEALAAIQLRSDAMQARAEREAAKPVVIEKKASKWGPGWEAYGDWHVKALHDEMDTVTNVRLFTDFKAIERYPAYGAAKPRDQNFGFELFGDSLVALSPSLFVGGKGYWPYCDYDLSSVSIDGAKAVRLATVDNPGSCNSVDRNGAVIASFLDGSQAKVRMHYDDGMISLKGFSEAWRRAIQLSK